MADVMQREPPSRPIILVVDDHEAVRGSLQRWLEMEFPHCSVVSATSGEEALTVVQARPPRVVVMDITLPGMSGIEATRRIKGSSPSTRIAILSIHESENHRAHAHAAGADAYVPKRTMRRELLRVVAGLLASPDPMYGDRDERRGH
jgi:DNA-binding NarL/FixJ family response regulator